MHETSAKPLYLAYPHGFCAGVRRAVVMAESALGRYPPPVYCLNEIVHNRTVVDQLTRQGIRFVNRVEDTPLGAVLLFSAHGVSPEVRETARARKLRTIDATCPFVIKVHHEVRRYAARGYTILLIGKRDHDEVVGVAGEAPEQVLVVENAAEARAVAVRDAGRVAAVSQTTLSLEAAGAVLAVLNERFPALVTPRKSDICHATTERQQAVRGLVRRAAHILVLGSPNSSNTLRLVEVGLSAGVPTTLIDTEAALSALDLSAIPSLGLTAGASTPEAFIDRVIAILRQAGFSRLEHCRLSNSKYGV